MNRFTKVLGVSLLALTVTVSGYSQTQERTKDEVYAEFVAKINNKPEAYKLGKEFLAKAGTAEDEYTKYVRDWVKSYEGEQERTKINAEFAAFDEAFKSNNFAEAVKTGKPLLARDANDLTTIMTIASIGYKNFIGEGVTANRAVKNDTEMYAKMALDKINAGVKPTINGKVSWFPYDNEANAKSWLNFIVAKMNWSIDGSEAAAVPYAFNTLRTGDSVFTDYYEPYYMIAYNYQNEFNKAANDYNAKYKDAAADNAEANTARGTYLAIAERAADAYVRAANAAKKDPKLSATAANMTKFAKDFYKNRKGSEAGFDAFAASVAAKPFADPSTPVTPVVDDLPSAAPTVTTSTNVKETTNSAGTPKSTATKTVTKTTTPTSTTTSTTTTKTNAAGTKTTKVTKTTTKKPVKKS